MYDYTQRLRIERSYSGTDTLFKSLMSKLPIHPLESLEKVSAVSATHSHDKLFGLLSEIFTHDKAREIIQGAMSGEEVEFSLPPLVPIDIQKRLAESDV